MDVAEIQRQYVHFGNSMYREGYLDEQFTQLQQLADETHPSFVMEVVTGFLDESEKILDNLKNAIEMKFFDEVIELSFALKGSSSSIGAKRFKSLFVLLKRHCDEKNLQGCMMCMDQIKEEYAIIKSKLNTLLELQQQIMAVGGAIPLLE